MYKSQIHPHFLFNTLNTLYGLFVIRSPRVEEAFEGFIDLVRYIYRNANRDVIPLSEEEEYLRHYVALQSLRLSDASGVTFRSEVEHPAATLPPMLLITFVENAFKYGVSSDGRTCIRIELHEADRRLHFTVENTVAVKERGDSARSGLANCRRRLDLLYPKRYRLLITESADLYRVELTLNMNDI